MEPDETKRRAAGQLRDSRAAADGPPNGSGNFGVIGVALLSACIAFGAGVAVASRAHAHSDRYGDTNPAALLDMHSVKPKRDARGGNLCAKLTALVDKQQHAVPCNVSEPTTWLTFGFRDAASLLLNQTGGNDMFYSSILQSYARTFSLALKTNRLFVIANESERARPTSCQARKRISCYLRPPVQACTNCTWR
eukprot:6210738-Pleurochrysis_carterae.AAC.5